MKSKKGAIELSVTTIIVIVIGITLLTLGLTWVRSSFSKVTDLTGQAFDLSDQAIDEMFSESNELLKVLPDAIELNKKSNSAEVGLIFYNLETTPLTFQAEIKPIENGIPMTCKFGDTLGTTTKSYQLNSGASEKIKVKIERTKETTLGTGGCDITITSLTSADTSYSLSEQVLVEVTG